MRYTPCLIHGHAWDHCKGDDRLEQCVRCLMVRIKRYRRAPKKALKYARTIVGTNQYAHPGPYTNVTCTANVWITDRVVWRRIAHRAGWAEYHLLVMMYLKGNEAPMLLSAGCILDTRYDAVLKLARKHVHKGGRAFFKAIAKELRGDNWKPVWWEKNV